MFFFVFKQRMVKANITSIKYSETSVLRESIDYLKDAIHHLILADCGYIDTKMLYDLQQNNIHYVISLRNNHTYKLAGCRDTSVKEYKQV